MYADSSFEVIEGRLQVNTTVRAGAEIPSQLCMLTGSLLQRNLESPMGALHVKSTKRPRTMGSTTQYLISASSQLLRSAHRHAQTAYDCMRLPAIKARNRMKVRKCRTLDTFGRRAQRHHGPKHFIRGRIYELQLHWLVRLQGLLYIHQCGNLSAKVR